MDEKGGGRIDALLRVKTEHEAGAEMDFEKEADRRDAVAEEAEEQDSEPESPAAQTPTQRNCKSFSLTREVCQADLP